MYDQTGRTKMSEKKKEAAPKKKRVPCTGDHMNAHLHPDGTFGYGHPCTVLR